MRPTDCCGLGRVSKSCADPTRKTVPPTDPRAGETLPTAPEPLPKVQTKPKGKGGGWKTTLKIPDTILKSSAQAQPALSSTSRGGPRAQWGSMREGGCAGNELWVGERCFRPARSVGATGGDRGGTLKALSPVRQHRVPGGLCTLARHGSHPRQGCQHPSAVENKPGVAQPSRETILGDATLRGGHLARGLGMVWLRPHPRSASPLSPLCPGGTRGSGGSGGSRLPPHRGFAPGMGRILLSPPRTGAGMLRTGGAARREGCERGCPVKNAPPAGTEGPGAASWLGPVLRSQPRLGAAQLRPPGRDPASRSPRPRRAGPAPRARKPGPGAPGDLGTRGHGATPRERPGPDTSGAGEGRPMRGP